MRSAAKYGSRAESPADADAPSPESSSSIHKSRIGGTDCAVIAVLGLIYLLKLVLITTLTSLLLAFILEPLV